MAGFRFYGNFEITTDCNDVDKIAQALDATAKQFKDILKWKQGGDGLMMIENNLEIEILLDTDEEDY